jgi:SAM-dependent methyltransferase
VKLASALRRPKESSAASLPDEASGLRHLMSKKFQGEVQSFAGKWDREWIRYFYQHDNNNYFRSYATRSYPFPLATDEIAAFTAEDTLRRRIDPEFVHTTLQVHLPGDAIVGKEVFEMGCGVGMLGRILGHLAKSYVGFDYSPLALEIARLTSPGSCRYVYAGDTKAIGQLHNSADTCLSRHFFIHNNFDNSKWVLKMLRDIVRDGGVIHADFFNAVEPAHQIYPAKSPLDVNAASCGFFYSNDEIYELADLCDLTVESITRVDKPPRVYVDFRRRSKRHEFSEV